MEIPVVSEGGSVGAYLATLDRLRPIAEQAAAVVPGHGAPLERDRALSVLDEDRTYLHALAENGLDAQLPPGRRTPAQRRIHAENIATARSS